MKLDTFLTVQYYSTDELFKNNQCRATNYALLQQCNQYTLSIVVLLN